MTLRYPCADALTALSSLLLSSVDRFGDRGDRVVLFDHETI